MLYFIPAWYKENRWVENEQFWYSRRMRSEFDESIKQIQLFHRNVGADYSILLLSYSPNLRHFLHRQGLYRAPYWSVFDSIQEIERTKISILSFHNIKWPKGIEFTYTPFAIVAFLNNVRYAVVQFGEDGNLISIDMYQDDQLCRRNYYDDRGFVSCTVIYEEGQEISRDYLTEKGIWKIRQFQSDGHIEINPKCPYYLLVHGNEKKQINYEKQTYASIEEVIEEIFRHYIELSSDKDLFFTAIHRQHISLLERVLKGKRIIATFFEKRFPYTELESIENYLGQVKYIITDSKDPLEQLREISGKNEKYVFDISPYDARMDFGISTQLSVQNILIPIDGISEEMLKDIIHEACRYLETNENAMIHLFTRDGNWGIEDRLKEKMADYLDEFGMDRRWAVEGSSAVQGETDIDKEEEDPPPVRFFVDSCVDERTISKCINEQRIILDFRATDDVFLFITALSKGVPRITIAQDPYFVNGKNGRLISGTEEIFNSLSYYLGSLEHWNEALVYCYEFGKQFSAKILLQAWREVLNSSE